MCRRSLRLVRALLSVLVVALASAASASAAGVLEISGGGDGHGIGMSQYGAEGYAEHGWSAARILGHYYTGTQLGSAPAGQTVRVLIATHGAGFAGAAAANAGSVRTALNPSATYSVSVDKQGRLVLSTGGHALKRRFTAPLTISGPNPLQVAGRGAYRGSLQYAPDGGGGVQTVDIVGLDDYVRGVVAAEMPSSWSTAALQAQAIAARTYALTTSVSGNGYDLYDDTRSQMYGGVGSETPATDAAVAATAGQVVTYNGQPVVTYFFASSGGQTESIQNVWPGSSPEPWLVGVADPYDGAAGDPYHSFTRQLSLAAAQARLRGLVQGSLEAIQVTRTGLSQRIITAQVVGTKGTTTVSGSQLAAAFGLPTTLASFTTITTHATPAGLTGTVAPAQRKSHVVVEVLSGAAWHTVGTASVRRGGAFRVSVLTNGRYRVSLGAMKGPTVALTVKRAPAVGVALRWGGRQL